MKIAKLLLLGLTFAIAGCATMNKSSLQNSSARLEDSTREFYSEVRAQVREQERKEVTPVTRAAEALIISSRDFNRAVERRATNKQVLSEFDRVARDYKQLADRFAGERPANRSHAEAEKFERVTEAYRAVENSMSSRQAVTEQATTKQAAPERVSMTPAQISTYNEIERRNRLKDYWFP